MADDPDLLVDAFALIAERGWSAFSRRDLAQRAGVSLGEVQALLPDRPALSSRLGQRLDRAMLAGDLSELDGMSVRERLFELIMKRLDATMPFRRGLAVIADRPMGAAELLAPSLGNLGRAADWMLDAAGAGLGGWRAGLGGSLLAALYARVLHVWLHDDTEDLASTMAELDRRLQQLERLAQWSAPAPRRPEAQAA